MAAALMALDRPTSRGLLTTSSFFRIPGTWQSCRGDCRTCGSVCVGKAVGLRSSGPRSRPAAWDLERPPNALVEFVASLLGSSRGEAALLLGTGQPRSTSSGLAMRVVLLTEIGGPSLLSL